jgi:putative copper export protein
MMDGRARVLGVLGAIFLFATALARLVAQTSAVEGGAATLAGMGAVLAHSLWGVGWVLQVAGGIAVLVWVTRSGPSARALWPLAMLGALGLAVSGALSGHAAGSAYSALAITADSVHVLGAAGWLGTLLVVAAAGLPAAGAEPDKRAGSVSALVNAFSPVALTCASLVVATGILSAWLRLRHWDAFTESRYGQTLLIKIAVLLPALAIGAYHWRKVRPSLEQPGASARLAGTVSLELSLGALVLAVTAVLVATPLPR